MLDPPAQQPGQDGASVEKRGLYWGCGRAAAVLGINSTKITPWGKSRRKGAFCWLTDLPSVQAPSPQPWGGSGAAAACHSPRPRRRSLGTRLGCPAPCRSPPSSPSSLGISGLIPAPNSSKHPLLPGQGCPEHPAPRPPCHCAPQKAFQAPFPKVVRKPWAAVPGRWMEPWCRSCAIIAAQGHRQSRDAPSASAREQCSAGTPALR